MTDLPAVTYPRPSRYAGVGRAAAEGTGIGAATGLAALVGLSVAAAAEPVTETTFLTGGALLLLGAPIALGVGAVAGAAAALVVALLVCRLPPAVRRARWLPFVVAPLVTVGAVVGAVALAYSPTLSGTVVTASLVTVTAGGLVAWRTAPLLGRLR